MSEQLGAAFRLLPGTLSQHVLLCACALALAVAVSLPGALYVAERPRLRGAALTAAGLVQTIPGLALIALFYPILLALSALTSRNFGFELPTLGFLPALLALTLYAILPILQNAILGLTGIDADVLEAADAVGMTRRQRLAMVDAPLAAPVAMAGVRTAAVWTIGAGTLATPVGQTSLGDYIFSGLQTENWVYVLFGCLAAALLAIATDRLLGLVERGAAKRDGRRAALGLAGLALGVAAAWAGAQGEGRRVYVIGAKNFSEQFILAELMADRLRAQGAGVSLKQGLGSAVVFRALAAGDLDVYVDYSGTLWTNVMGRADAPPRAQMLEEITQWMARERGVLVLGALGFENAYGLVMRRARADELQIRTIGDLAAQAPALTLGADLEFASRPEWRSLRDAYGLNFKAIRNYNPTLMYRALATGDADVASGFTSDGRIAAEGLVALDDPRQAIPPYDALILVAPRRADDARLREALKPLIGAIDVAHMREANFSVDRDDEKRTPQAAARALWRAVSARPDSAR